jgi:hypothetical protein
MSKLAIHFTAWCLGGLDTWASRRRPRSYAESTARFASADPCRDGLKGCDGCNAGLPACWPAYPGRAFELVGCYGSAGSAMDQWIANMSNSVWTDCTSHL